MSVVKVRAACESIVTINVTPFGADGAVDLDTYAALVDRQGHAGIDVGGANGNTGEFYALDREEQAGAGPATGVPARDAGGLGRGGDPARGGGAAARGP